MKRSVIGIFALLLSIGLVFSGCGKPQDEGKKDATGKTEEKKSITVKGSDTMVHLASGWAEGFMKANPNIQVSVTGGGSGTGITALINGTTDICTASRPMKDKEKQDLAAKGGTATEFSVALDGISVVVNPKSPVKELTMEQLAKIFTGEAKSWKDFGGPDKPISILSRESSSGTYIFFQEHVMAKKDYSKDAKLMPATNSIIEEVASNEFAIGYVGLGYASQAGAKVKVIGVKKDDKATAVMPTDATVKDGSYPIARSLYLYTSKAPEGSVKAFIDFCLSPEGQKIAVENDQIAVK